MSGRQFAAFHIHRWTAGEFRWRATMQKIVGHWRPTVNLLTWQRLCFRNTDSTIPLLPKSQASSHLLWVYSPVCVGTWSETPKIGFLTTTLISLLPGNCCKEIHVHDKDYQQYIFDARRVPTIYFKILVYLNFINKMLKNYLF